MPSSARLTSVLGCVYSVPVPNERDNDWTEQPMSPDAILTIAVVAAMLLALSLELLAPDIILFVSLAVLFLAGILTPQEAFLGFSNEGMLTVAVLFVVAYAAQSSGVLEIFAGRVMGRGAGLRRSIVRIFSMGMKTMAAGFPSRKLTNFP